MYIFNLETVNNVVDHEVKLLARVYFFDINITGSMSPHPFSLLLWQ